MPKTGNVMGEKCQPLTGEIARTKIGGVNALEAISLMPKQPAATMRVQNAARFTLIGDG
jgi:hypothetical protein